MGLLGLSEKSLQLPVGIDSSESWTKLGLWGQEKVLVKFIRRDGNVNMRIRQRQSLLILSAMKQTDHDNLNKFVGICLNATSPSAAAIVWNYMTSRNLEAVIYNDEMKMDMVFKISLMKDIIRGLVYIHNSRIGVHGNLVASNCLIDRRWTVKLTNFGINNILNNIYEQNLQSLLLKVEIPTEELLTMAPEVLAESKEKTLGECRATKAADTYSLGMVFHQLLFRQQPFDLETESADEILKKLANKTQDVKPQIPQGSDEVSPGILDMIQSCWRKSPELRPNIKHIQNVVYGATTDNSKSLMEHMMHKLERYVDNLEKLVDTRTRTMQEEKHRADELLSRTIPKSVADKLKNGVSVTPEKFECVTIMSSDIADFKTICSLLAPTQLVKLLNDVYWTFDRIIDTLDVYRVETVGDAYLMVSGLPEKNGFKHVTELGQLSTKLVEVRTGRGTS